MKIKITAVLEYETNLEDWRVDSIEDLIDAIKESLMNDSLGVFEDEDITYKVEALPDVNTEQS